MRAGLLACAALCACTSIGRDLTSGAGDGLKPQMRQLTYEAAGGLKDNLLSEDTKKRVLELERAVVSGATESLASQETQERLRNLENALIDQLRVDLLKTENSLLGEELDKKLAALRQELIGPATKADLISIRDELLGPRLHEAVSALVQDALGPQTQAQVGALRDQLVGKPMQDAIDALIKQATKTLASEWQSTVRPVLDDTERRARNIAIWVAVGVGVVSAGLIAQAHYLRGKYKGIATLLAAKIEEVAPNHAAPIKREIEKEAISKGLERNLHHLLYDAGINKT